MTYPFQMTSEKQMKNLQFILSLGCAFALGLAFTVPQAIGLGTPSVDMGTNPIFSFAGQASTGSNGVTQTITTAPTDKDMRITDIQMSSCCDQNAYGANITLSTSSGTTLGKWNVNRNTLFAANMKSGLILPAGEELIITAYRNNYSVTIFYTISGQYIRP